MASREEIAELIAQLHGPQGESAQCSLTSMPETLSMVAAACRAEREPERRAMLIHCLWQYRNPAAVPTLGSALRDADDQVWKEALDGLVTLGGAEAARVLRDARAALVGDETRVKREWLEEAIEQLGEGNRPG
jgi:HEAT repeat protein